MSWPGGFSATTAILAIVVGYLIGSIPFGLLLTRAAGLGDIRKIGSGNIGATNVLRTGRRGLALATLLLDGAKGAAGVLIAVADVGPWGVLVGGVAAVLGHLFPAWLSFRGGKGVAAGFGVLIAASPVVGLTCGAVWLIVAWLTRISSASALSAFAAAPILAGLLVQAWPLIALALILAVLIYIRHEENIRRLIAGTEPRIGQRH